MGDATAARLRTLLEDERAALQSGALDRLEELLARKERLAAELEVGALACSEGEAAALRRLALRNEGLIEAVRGGLRAAIDRVGERARLARSVDTYDAAGNRKSLAPTPGALHRRW
jgi:hypothetical protein